jgi:hypothetical protein
LLAKKYLAVEVGKGYYIPIHHTNPPNASGSEVK